MESIQESLNSVLTVWFIAWRSVWPLILMFVTVTVCDLLLPSPQPDQPTSPQRGLLLRLWIGPLLLCIWGGINWGAEQSFLRKSALTLLGPIRPCPRLYTRRDLDALPAPSKHTVAASDRINPFSIAGRRVLGVGHDGTFQHLALTESRVTASLLRKR